MQLRDYQDEAIANVLNDLETYQRTTVFSPTGTGKTVMFCDLARRASESNKRCMILVDRTELVKQTQASIRQWTGIHADIEQADQIASTHDTFASPVVIATVQTLRSAGGTRKERFDPKKFQMLIVDECHLSITPTTLSTIDWFAANSDCKIVGFTATPKRQDNRSLKQAFEHCSFNYTIEHATKDGWLVPCKCKVAQIDSIDFSTLPNRKSDWTTAQISDFMEANETPLKTAQATVELAKGKQTLVFCARVSHAESVCRYLNELEPGSSAVVHGKTPKEERAELIHAFNTKELKRIVNCGVLTTGFDSPNVEVIVNARPTKSWALFTQIVGRALRPLPGVVDGPETPEERRAAIAASAKPYAEIISVVGRTACMELAGPADVFAGDTTPPEVIDRANEILQEGEIENPEEAIIKAEEEYEEEIKRLKELEYAPLRVHINYTVEDVDLYKTGEFKKALEGHADIPAKREVAFLVSAGFSLKEMRGWSGEKVKMAILVLQERHEQGLATKKQCNMLKRLKVPDQKRRNMTRIEASRYMAKKFGYGQRSG